jgi:putative transposase
MARFARVVVPGLAYHLTHRGNRRGDMFFCQEDREVYLPLLAESVARFGVDLWAKRFPSCALDEDQLWAAVRCVEQNPVRAKLVSRCVDYPWLDSGFHGGLCERPAALVENWLDGVNGVEDRGVHERLRQCTTTGRPCGSRGFVDEVERQRQRNLSPANPSRSRKLLEEPSCAPDLLE